MVASRGLIKARGTSTRVGMEAFERELRAEHLDTCCIQHTPSVSSLIPHAASAPMVQIILILVQE